MRKQGAIILATGGDNSNRSAGRLQYALPVKPFTSELCQLCSRDSALTRPTLSIISAMGKFYEGYMVTGVTTDATDAAVQANIVAVGYKNPAFAGYRH
jgi:hypothetical protein